MLKQRAFEELKLLAGSEQFPSGSRADAAMTLSECYAIGYGTEHDSGQLVHWLNEARLLGHEKATAWYHRVCLALDISAIPDEENSIYQVIEQDLVTLPTERYLESRIQKLVKAAVLDAQNLASEPDFSNLGLPCQDARYQVKLFISSNVDEVGPLHFAALIGNTTSVIELLQIVPVNSLSKNGFCPIHYACMGGHLSILDILIRNGACAHTKGPYGITPLHLSIFFASLEAPPVVELLLAHGASSEEETTSMIYWTDNDLKLTGTPLHWATSTRNQALVKALLPHPSTEECLQVAIWRFYWEIVELLLEHLGSTFQPMRDSLQFGTITEPFSHWIAHGRDRFDSITRTIHSSRSLHLLRDRTDYGESCLMSVVNTAAVEDDFRLIEDILSHMTDAEVKETDTDGFSALMWAIAEATHHSIWTGTLKALIGYYTVEELEAESMFSNSYIHYAITRGSVIGARILLEKGVNANQPTFDVYALTPLHLCKINQNSPDMFQLLVKHGADLELRDGILDQNPFQTLVWGHFKSRGLLDISLKHQKDERLITETLHELLFAAAGAGGPNRSDALEAFKHILKDESVVKCIDFPDQNGATLLHKAAYVLEPRTIKILLEAGADANIPLRVGDSQTFPLQVACAVGRLHSQRPSRDKDAQLIEASLNVSRELLQWHKVNGDLFYGISLLHLAAHMRVVEEVSRLVELQYDTHEKGSWPSLRGSVTPVELMKDDLDDDFAAVDTLSLGLLRKYGKSQMETPISTEGIREATLAAKTSIASMLVS